MNRHSNLYVFSFSETERHSLVRGHRPGDLPRSLDPQGQVADLRLPQLPRRRPLDPRGILPRRGRRHEGRPHPYRWAKILRQF